MVRLWLKNHKSFLFLILLSTGLDIFLLRNIFGLGLVQAADWPIPILTSGQLKYMVFGAWNFQGSSPSGFNLYLVYTGFLSVLTHNPAIVQKLFYIIPWFFIPYPMYFFLKCLKIRPCIAVPFAMLYQFGPWINGQFMDGEPVFVSLYLFLPLFLLVYMKYKESFLLLYIAATLTLIIPIIYTLQAITYFFFLFPFILSDLLLKRVRTVTFSVLSLIFSVITVVIATLYSVGVYSSAFSSDEGNPISSFLTFTPAVVARYWLLSFFGLTLVIAVISILKKSEYRTLFTSWVIVSGLLLLIYPGMGITEIGSYLMTRVFIFAPFINFDKFILFLWFSLLVMSAWLASVSLKFSITHVRNIFRKDIIHSIRRFFSPSRSVLAIAVIALLVSSASLEIQSFGSHDTGRYLFTSGLHFDDSKVSPQCIKLVNFLTSNNVSYGLSPHTILFPENPGNSLPFYIGQQIIPGYIGEFGRNISQAIINGLNENNSDFLMTLSLYGIEYLAVMNIPRTSWSGSNGTPSLSMWGDNYIFIGNWTYYLQDLEKLSGLTMVFNDSGLFIFRNNFYISPVVQGTASDFQNLTAQNYTHFINTTAVSGNIMHNTTYYYLGTDYKLNSALNLTVSGNYTVTVYSIMQLLPDTTYKFRVNYNTTENLTRYYGAGQSGVGIYYNVTPTHSNVTGGIVLTFKPAYIASGTYSGIFTTPMHNGYINAKFEWYIQPPLGQARATSDLSDVSLYAINGSTQFFGDFRAAPVSNLGYSTFSIKVNRDAEISIDQFFGSNWIFYGLGNSGKLSENTMGLLSFDATHKGTYTVAYTGQYVYTTELYISFGGLIYVLALFPLFIIIRNRSLKCKVPPLK